MKFALPLLFVSLSIKGSVGQTNQTSCANADDCAETDFCAVGNICTAYGCEELYDIIKDQIDGIEALECMDYSGQGEAQVYACSVGTGISGGNLALVIEPKETSIIQPFARECMAMIPGDAGESFYCLDNKDTSFDDYLSAAAAAGLDCGGDAPIHATVRINLLSGLSIGAVRKEEFDEAIARSGYFADIGVYSSSDSGGGSGGNGGGDGGDGGDGSSNAAAGGFFPTSAWVIFGLVLTALF